MAFRQVSKRSNTAKANKTRVKRSRISNDPSMKLHMDPSLPVGTDRVLWNTPREDYPALTFTNLFNMGQLFNSKMVIAIMNKMDIVQYTRLIKTCKAVILFVRRYGSKISVKFDGELIIGRQKSGRNGKDIEDDPKVYYSLHKKDKDFTNYYPVDQIFGNFYGLTPSSVMYHPYSKNQVDYPDEMIKHIKEVVGGRKWNPRDRPSLQMTENHQFDDLTQPIVVFATDLPVGSEVPSSVETLYFDFEKRSTSFEDWARCGNVKFVQVTATTQNSVSNQSAKALVEAWKDNNHGNLKLVEFVFIDHGVYVELMGYLACLNRLFDTLVDNLGLEETPEMKERRVVGTKKMTVTSQSNRGPEFDRVLGEKKWIGLKQTFFHNHRPFTVCLQLKAFDSPCTRKFNVVLRLFPDYNGPVPLVKGLLHKCFQIIEDGKNF